MTHRLVVLLCLGLLSHLLVASAAGGPCSDDDVPVCARSRRSGMHFLFGNECDLRKAQRGSLMDGPLYDVPLRFCLPNCDFECGSRYQPVCGMSSRTGERKSFRNRCEIVRASCLSGSDWWPQHWGVCPRMNKGPLVSQKTPKAQPHPKQSLPQPVPCTKIYRPVCAMYAGVKSTFTNECLVNAENIKTQRNWRIVSEGLCGEDSIKMKYSRKFKPKAKPKVDMERTKRSHTRSTQAEDFQIPEDAVEIYAPSTFHTEFISNTGAMVKSYSLPARKPYVVASPKSKSKEQRVLSTGKSCVFGNEPVCGSFKAENRTFSSVCELMEYSQKVGNAWTISYEGACRRCDKPCPTVYKPICATRNGIQNTIINECYLERARCKDPVNSWTFSHKGECAKPVGVATKAAPVYKSRTLPLVPRVLFGTQRKSSTLAPMPRTRKSGVKAITKAPTSYTTRLVAKRSSETTHPPSLKANNRKIRRIDMSAAGLSELKGSSGFIVSEYVPASEAPWSSNDNWLVQKTLDNVQGLFSKKAASFKKAQDLKYPKYHWSSTPRISTTTTTTTAVPVLPERFLDIDISELLNWELENAGNANSVPSSTAPPSASSSKVAQVPKALSLASTELLNLDIGNSANAYDDAEPELLFLMSTKEAANASSTPSVLSSTTPPSSTQSSTTELPPSWEASSPMEESTRDGSITDPEGTTDSPTSASTNSATSTTTAATPYPTTEAEEILSQTTGSESPTTLAADELPTTTQNTDYTLDEAFSESSGQTSIYGLDKNSLIMRLLRARRNKDVFI